MQAHTTEYMLGEAALACALLACLCCQCSDRIATTGLRSIFSALLGTATPLKQFSAGCVDVLSAPQEHRKLLWCAGGGGGDPFCCHKGFGGRRQRRPRDSPPRHPRRCLERRRCRRDHRCTPPPQLCEQQSESSQPANPKLRHLGDSRYTQALSAALTLQPRDCCARLLWAEHPAPDFSAHETSSASMMLAIALVVMVPTSGAHPNISEAASEDIIRAPAEVQSGE